MQILGSSRRKAAFQSATLRHKARGGDHLLHSAVKTPIQEVVHWIIEFEQDSDTRLYALVKSYVSPHLIGVSVSL